jgi:RHS repeat-associated protein
MDRPGEGAALEGDVIAGSEGLGELEDGMVVGGDPLLLENVSVGVQDTNLDEFFVDVQSNEAYHQRTSCEGRMVEVEWAGDGINLSGLAAQPGSSQGRPATRADSRSMKITGLPTLPVTSEAPGARCRTLYSTSHHGTRLFHTSNARWYDPEVGRFVSRDPGEPGESGTFGFVANNPVGNVDPDGRYVVRGGTAAERATVGAAAADLVTYLPDPRLTSVMKCNPCCDGVTLSYYGLTWKQTIAFIGSPTYYIVSGPYRYGPDWWSKAVFAKLSKPSFTIGIAKWGWVPSHSFSGCEITISKDSARNVDRSIGAIVHETMHAIRGGGHDGGRHYKMTDCIGSSISYLRRAHDPLWHTHRFDLTIDEACRSFSY